MKIYSLSKTNRLSEAENCGSKLSRSLLLLPDILKTKIDPCDNHGPRSVRENILNN